MKLEKLEKRLAILEKYPGDERELARIMRMIGDELPRFRCDILDKARASIARTAAVLERHSDSLPACMTGSVLLAACEIITSYQAAAASRHCALCETPLVEYYILDIVRSDMPHANLCPECIQSALHRISPPAADAFTTALKLKKEVEGEDGAFDLRIGDSENKKSGSPTLHVYRATYRRTT